ncbi:15962_t:CDS:2, partial [Racocetra persica]
SDILSSELDTLSSTSNILSSNNQSTIMEEVGLQSEIIAALSIITTDLPQGNNLVDTKCYSSNQECRSCLVSKEQLSDISFDIKLNA